MEKKDLLDIIALLPRAHVQGSIQDIEPLRKRIGELIAIIQKEIDSQEEPTPS